MPKVHLRNVFLTFITKTKYTPNLDATYDEFNSNANQNTLKNVASNKKKKLFLKHTTFYGK